MKRARFSNSLTTSAKPAKASRHFLQALTALLLTLLLSLPAQAATWYMSPSGSTTNGTKVSPWSVEFATGNAGANSYLLPGDTVYMVDGSDYACTNYSTLSNTTNILLFKISGTPAAKITYRPETWLGAKFNGGLQAETASNLVVTHFEIRCTWATNRTLRGGSGFLPPGINEYTQGNDLWHNWIHDTGHPGIGSWLTTAGKSIRGNIIFAPGYDDAGNSRGSGMYLQNGTNTSTALIKGNISIFPYTTGMKAYGNPPIWDFWFDQNFITDGDEGGIFMNQDDSPMRLPIPPARITKNVIWKGGHEGQMGGIRFGYQSHPATGSNAVIVANYVVERAFPLSMVGGWAFNTVKSNTLINLYDKFKVYNDLSGEGGFPTTHFFDWNSYFYTNTGSVDFKIADVVKSTSQWQSDMAGDSNSTFTAGFPASNYIQVVQPSPDSNFVHVAVVNWTGASAANADISAYFSPGDRVRVIDAQNMPVAFTTNTISGSTISLDLTRTNRHAMLGSFTNTKTNQWLGFDPQLRFFVLYREALATPVTNVTSYAQTTAIQIPADTSFKATNGFPSILRVANNWGAVVGVKVTISNLLHTFTDDINIALQCPNGETVMLMSDCADDSTDIAKTFSFSTSATYLMPAGGSGSITNGQDFLPNNAVSGADNFPIPAPPQPYTTNMAALIGGPANGEWKLWVTDDFSGDGGSIDGWYLQLTTTNILGNPIPYHRLISWGDSINGVPGGIPTGWTNFCDVTVSIPGTNIVAIPNTTNDCAVPIATAIQLAAQNGAASNRVVYMPAGTYLLKTNVFAGGIAGFATLHNVILRGAGTNLTILQADFTNNTASIFNVGGFSLNGTSRTNFTDVYVGSTNLYWTNLSGVTAGTMILLKENDASTNTFNPGWSAGSADPVHYQNPNGTKAVASDPLVRQLFMVQSVSGSNITVWPPSNFNFHSNYSVGLVFQTYSTRYFGLEDFTLKNMPGGLGTNTLNNFLFTQTYGCWMKNVVSDNAKFGHVNAQYCLMNSLLGSRLVGAPAVGPSQGVGAHFASHNTNWKVENNVFDSNFPAIEFYLGTSGMAVMLNAAVNCKGGLQAFDFHNAHHSKNLFEGNIANAIGNDGYFGSAEQATLHRNWLHGTPADTGFRRCVDLGSYSRNWNVVNNVLGESTVTWVYDGTYTNGWTGGMAAIYRGQPNMGNTTFTGTNNTIQATNTAALDPYVYTNLIRHLNFDYATGAIVNDASIAATASPVSYYANYNSSAAPSWYTNAVWPPIGSELTTRTNGNPAWNYYYNTSVSSTYSRRGFRAFRF